MNKISSESGWLRVVVVVVAVAERFNVEVTTTTTTDDDDDDDGDDDDNDDDDDDDGDGERSTATLMTAITKSALGTTYVGRLPTESPCWQCLSATISGPQLMGGGEWRK